MDKILPDPRSGKILKSSELNKSLPAPNNPEKQPDQKVTFQQVLKQVSQGSGSTVIRKDLVDQYRDLLAQGTYEVKAQELAEKMIQKIRENKSREIV